MTELRPDTRALIEAAAREEAGPSPQASARMKAAIAAQIAVGAAAASAAHASPTGGGVASAGASVVTKLVVTSAIAGVIATGAWQWAHHRDGAAPMLTAAAARTMETPTPMPSASSVVEGPAIDAAPPAPTEPPPPPAEPEPPPSRAELVRRRAPAVVPPPAPQAPPASPASPAPTHDDRFEQVERAAQSLAEESVLLEAAEEAASAERATSMAIESALARGDLARARVLLEALEAEHPTKDERRRALIERVRRASEAGAPR